MLIEVIAHGRSLARMTLPDKRAELRGTKGKAPKTVIVHDLRSRTGLPLGFYEFCLRTGRCTESANMVLSPESLESLRANGIRGHRKAKPSTKAPKPTAADPRQLSIVPNEDAQ